MGWLPVLSRFDFVYFSCLKLLQQTLGFGIGFEYFHVSLRENDHREKSGYEKKKNILMPYLHGFKIEWK